MIPFLLLLASLNYIPSDFKELLLRLLRAVDPQSAPPQSAREVCEELLASKHSRGTRGDCIGDIAGMNEMEGIQFVQELVKKLKFSSQDLGCLEQTVARIGEAQERQEQCDAKGASRTDATAVDTALFWCNVCSTAYQNQSYCGARRKCKFVKHGACND